MFENKIEFAKFLSGRIESYELNGDKFEMFSAFGDENVSNFMSVVVTGKNADGLKHIFVFMPKATMIGFYRRCMAKIYNGVDFKKVYFVYAKLI